ncbi:MAG: anthranilate synthase component I [Rhodospirillaceae bacterium]|nr:MAG: anthranilate synthase component I [Rhodospirillaceae bacterium]
MDIHPRRSEFEAVYAAGKAQVVWAELAADLDTPVSIMLKLGQDRRFSALLESVEGGAVRGRYSFIALDPDLVWRCHGQVAEMCRTIGDGPLQYAKEPDPTLTSLRALVAASRITLPEHLPPMAAGLIGYMGYDTIRLVENIPDKNPDSIGIPDGMFMRPTVIVIFDNVNDIMTIVTPVYPAAGTDGAAAYADATGRIHGLMTALERPVPHLAPATTMRFDEAVSNIGRDGYHEMVLKAKEYILAGDIFQVVPSQRFRLPFALPAFSLYRSLRRLNPSPFLFHLSFDGFAIVGSSPEILVRLREGKVTIRPLAGTRPRGKTKAEDEALAAELLADPKERAEHLMLLDLGRNDVGRVCKAGTVKVTEQMVIERYSHVMHVVSNVEGDIAPGYDAMDALMAGFPAGTVSGAPKVRAMEIIDELETERRTFYGGAIGYLSANGDMDTCIALRTALVKDGEVIIQAGGGVVVDSDPEAEFQESNNKAKALVDAAKEAVRFFAGGNR